MNLYFFCKNPVMVLLTIAQSLHYIYLCQNHCSRLWSTNTLLYIENIAIFAFCYATVKSLIVRLQFEETIVWLNMLKNKIHMLCCSVISLCLHFHASKVWWERKTIRIIDSLIVKGFVFFQHSWMDEGQWVKVRFKVHRLYRYIMLR